MIRRRKISPKEALTHLIISREKEGYINFEKKRSDLMKLGWNTLKSKTNLSQNRFKQCYECEITKHFFENVPINELYNKYFCKSHDDWECDYLINFAYKHFDRYDLSNFNTYSTNPHITIIKLQQEERYNILDGNSSNNSGNQKTNV